MILRHMLKLVGLVMLALISGVMMIAQEAEDDASLYADIPQFRAEDGAFVLGDPDAPVTIIEFADYLCPHCQNYTGTIHQFIREYVVTGQAKLEYRFFPIIDQELSPLLSVLTECAGEDDMFWEAHDYLYEAAEARAIDEGLPVAFSEALGLDFEEVLTCASMASQYQIDYILGTQLGVTGTPAIRVRVGDDAPGVISIDGTRYDRGGVPLEILGQFVESENPIELVRFVNQLRNPYLFQDTSLVTGEPCDAPCWEGITPGETTWDDAIVILEALEAEDRIADLQFIPSEGDPSINAVWVQPDGDPCCRILTDDGETVSFMILQVAPEMSLDGVIEKWGEPEFTSASEVDNRQVIFNLFYTEVPMIVYVFAAGMDDALSDSSTIIGMTYLVDVDMQDVLANIPLTTWPGYITYADYLELELGIQDE